MVVIQVLLALLVLAGLVGAFLGISYLCVFIDEEKPYMGLSFLILLGIAIFLAWRVAGTILGK